MKYLLVSNTSWYLFNYRLPLIRLLGLKGDVALLSPPDEYSPKLSTERSHHISLVLSRRGMNPLSELMAIVRLARIYKREKPTVVHHFTIKCVLYGSLAARLVGIRGVVNSITGLGYAFARADFRGRILNIFAKTFYRFALRNTEVIFQNAEDMESFIKAGLLRSEQVTLIRGSGVDLTQYPVCPESGDTPIVLLAARLLWDKGIGEFVECARQIKESGLSARFVLVGDSDPGNPNAIPPEQLRAWHDSNLIEWWGWRDDMPTVVSSSHIVCLPSNYKEGLPRLLLEAAACARPVVASDIPGCREVVTHGHNGLLVPPQNVARLTDAVKSLLLNPDIRFRMGQANRLRAEQQFSAPLIDRATLDVYEQALLHSSQ